jgi:cytochrome c551/c552
MQPTPKSLRTLRAASGVVIFLLLTGLFPLLAPLGIMAQWVLLAHIVVGFLVIVPLTWIFLRHRSHAAAHGAKGWFTSGNLSWLGWLAVVVSGIWLTAVGIWGRFTPYGWHIAHVAVGLLLGLAAVLHLVRGLLRTHFPQARYRELAAAVIVLGLALGVGGGILWYARRAPPARQVSFAPSNASTFHHRAIPASLLTGSAACGTCHQTIYKEWLPSTHHYSATDLFYQAVKDNYIRARGWKAVRYCAGCHEPVTLLSGRRFHRITRGHIGAAGQSCAFCHLIRDTATRGNANYVVIRPTPYLFEQSHQPLLLAISDMLIRLHPQQHNADYNVKPAQSALFCGTCHKQYISKRENGWGFVQLQDQYDSWKNGPWHTDPRKNLICEDCHMPAVRADDPARNAAGFIHDHRILASNNYMAALLHLPGARRQAKLVDRWMAGKTIIPAIAGKWPRGPIVPVMLQPQGAFLPGHTARLQALVINAKVGHEFPTGPLDVIESWLELVVTDAHGRRVFATGYVNAPNGPIQGKTVEFRSHLLDRNAHPVYTHSLWNVVGATGKLVIPPGASYSHIFKFPLPRGVAGPLHCRLRLLYRKFNSNSQLQLFGPHPPPVPVMQISAATRIVDLSPAAARASVRPRRAGSQARR